MGAAEDEVVQLTSELIQIDSSNTGELETTTGEAEAAAYVDAKLREVGYETEIVESGAPGRHNVFCRLAGADPSRPPLLVHGHLDVVPFTAEDWSVHPLSGAVQDGYVWGRGAVDMKDMDAMILALARQFRREGIVPPRDLVFAFLADEEAGGAYGSHWLAEHRPDLFAGCTEALGEVGGFSVTLGEDTRVYPVMTAEKSIAWMKLRVRSRPGHGSMIHDENAVTILAEAVARLGRHRFPLVLTESVQGFFAEITELTGIEFPTDSAAALDGAVQKLGGVARVVGATTRDTANPTMLSAGYKANVIPAVAEATVDCRVLPGRQEAFERELDELLGPDVEREWIRNLPAVETEFSGDLVDTMTAAVQAEDPGCHTLPYMMSGGTDAKAFETLGMRCFGFAPLRLPPDLDFTALFHGTDERVPVDALQFGTRVLEEDLPDVLITENTVALVTGGASGIGEAVVRRLAGAGAKVAVVDRDAVAATAVADDVAGLAISCDVTSPTAMAAAVAEAETWGGRLDVVHLNAGSVGGQSGITDLDVEAYRRVVGVNVDHVVYGLTAAVPALRRTGGGAIIATSSLAGLVPLPGDAIYTLTKHAVVGYVRSAAATLAPEGIRAMALCPGFADTALIAHVRDQFAGFPLLSADDVADAVSRMLADGGAGECWFVQPGREPGPYGFRGVPGPKGGDAPPDLSWEH